MVFLIFIWSISPLANRNLKRVGAEMRLGDKNYCLTWWTLFADMHLGGFGSIVENKNLAKMISKRDKEEYHFNSYSLAARTCMKKVFDWYRRERMDGLIEFIFEDGDFGKGKFLDQFKNQP
jgi:hypothetical protein